MKNKLFLLVSLAGMLALNGCDGKTAIEENVNLFTFPYETAVQSDYLELSSYNYHIAKDATQTIAVTSVPSNYKEDQLVFTSSNPSVATVDASGKITGVALGTTTINVKTKDNKYNLNCNVFVTESKTVEAGVNELHEMYNQIGSTRCTKAAEIEIAGQKLIKNNVVQSSYKSVEVIQVDAENAYFKVESDDLNTKTANGSISKSSGAWIFYTDADFNTFMFHKTPSAKRYMIMKTYKYMENNGKRIDAIYGVLDMFFVAGRDIATDLLASASTIGELEGDSGLLDLVDNDYSNCTKEFLGSGEKNLIALTSVTFTDQDFSLSDEESTGAVGSTAFIDETDFAGDKYNAIQYIDYYFNNYSLVGYNVSVEENWTASRENNAKYSYQFSRSSYFEKEFELEIPDISEYAKVDSLYDL